MKTDINSHKRSGGFAIAELVLLVLLVAVIGFAGWFVYHRHQVADSNLASFSGKVTSLDGNCSSLCHLKVNNKIVTASSKASSSSAKTSNSPAVSSHIKVGDSVSVKAKKTSPNQYSVANCSNCSIKKLPPTPTTNNNKDHYLVLGNWGVELPLTHDIYDATYSKGGSAAVYLVTSPTLTKARAASACATSGPPAIARSTKSSITSGHFIRKIGSYNYFLYGWPQMVPDNCRAFGSGGSSYSGPSVSTLENALVTAIKNVEPL